MVELVDMLDLGSSAEGRVGSSPTKGRWSTLSHLHVVIIAYPLG